GAPNPTRASLGHGRGRGRPPRVVVAIAGAPFLPISLRKRARPRTALGERGRPSRLSPAGSAPAATAVSAVWPRRFRGVIGAPASSPARRATVPPSVLTIAT